MEVRLTPAIEQVIPPQISFNFEEIKSELAGKLQVYQNMVVTESVSRRQRRTGQTSTNSRPRWRTAARRSRRSGTNRSATSRAK